MKIAHIADIHWGLGYPGPTPQARFEDITRVMDWVADKIIDERCDLVLVAGDMFRKADTTLEKGSREIRGCTAWLRKITGAGIEILIIPGTPSHDPAAAYDILKDYQLPHVTIVTEPIWFDYDGAFGCSIVCIPGMDRSNFATKDEFRGLPAHVVHQMMTEHITETCQQFRNESNYTPSILVGHLTYDLADTGFEDVLMQNEAILTTEAVQGYELVALGHIHRPQQNGTVFYSGSPERLSFNDEKVDAGFWIHEWDEDAQKFDSQFIDTPARQFITLHLSENEIVNFVHGNTNFENDFGDFKDAIVRVNYKCSEDVRKQFHWRSFEKSLYKFGAFFVADPKGDIERVDRMRDSEVTESLGPIEAVQKWAENQEFAHEEIAELTAMTAQLMEVA